VVDTQPGPLETSVAAALTARATTDPHDAAAEQLAVHYATLIDAAAPAAKYRRPLETLQRAVALLDALSGGDDQDSGEDATEALAKVRDALAQHSVASDLGPKLLAALEALQLTPRARAAAMKGGAAGEPAKSPLDELRARRARRHSAEAVDATAP
jgi:hypothetical protein